MRIRLFLILLLIALLLAGCGEASPAPVAPTQAASAPRATATAPARPTAKPTQVVDESSNPECDPDNFVDQQADVDELFSFIGEDEPGAAVIVICGDQILYEQGYGMADVEEGTPITPDTPFHLASVGKQFTALGIMMLYEEGEIDYDEPVGTYLPELEGLGEEVTIRRLMQHIGGLPGHEYGDSEIYEEVSELAEFPENAELLEVMSEWVYDDLPYEPGEEYDYSNVGYELLGSVIERVSGQTLGEFLEARVFGPLDMDNTFSAPNPERLADPERAKGYDADSDFELYDSDPLDNITGSGSVFSSVHDMYRYELALDNYDLVSEETFAEALEQAELADGSTVEYGFGWEVGEDGGVPYTGHSGTWVGFNAYYLRYSERPLTVIVLSNRTDVDPDQLSSDVATLYW